MLWSFEPLSASEILQQVTFDKAAVSRALRSLEQRELIVRQSQSQDRRSANVRLTRRGQQIYRQILTQVSAVQLEMLAGLTPAQTDTLFQAHDILETYLRRRLEPDATD